MSGRCIICGRELGYDGMCCDRCMEDEPSLETTKGKVTLNTPKDISSFAKLAGRCCGDVVLRSGHYAVDAKSLMGIYSLDLSKPVTVEFYGGIPKEVKDGLKKFILKEGV